MEYIKRQIIIEEALKQKSIFLFGPRQTGKSSLIKQELAKDIPEYSLLDKALFLELSINPSLIRQKFESMTKPPNVVVIDEIQKIPMLLDEIHLMIENLGIHFLITGSSPRKLKTESFNMLGGRARERFLHPLIFSELREKFNLIRALNRGLLPSIYFSENAEHDLESYVGTYLDQEIAVEAKVRDIPIFSRFLQVAAMLNGKIINQSSVSNDVGIKRHIVAEYFRILKDTLLGYELPAWLKSKKRKPIETSKFYLFDVGIRRAILNLPIVKEKSADFGESFEHYIFHELRTYIDYVCPWASLNYWRSTSGFEVDFILNNETAIEVKGVSRVNKGDLKGLEAIYDEKNLKNFIIVSLETDARVIDNKFLILPWKDFLSRLWTGEYVTKKEELP